MEQKDFRVSCVTDDKELALNLPIEEFEEKLNAQFNLEDYGLGVKELLIVFIVLPSDNTSHESKWELNQSIKAMEIGIRLPYSGFTGISKEKALIMMKQEFLKLLDWCKESNTGNMSWSKLKEDIKLLL